VDHVEEEVVVGVGPHVVVVEEVVDAITTATTTIIAILVIYPWNRV
jgi:hypothetical protein